MCYFPYPHPQRHEMSLVAYPEYQHLWVFYIKGEIEGPLSCQLLSFMCIFVKYMLRFSDDFSVKLVQTFAKRVGPTCPFLCLLSCASTIICDCRTQHFPKHRVQATENEPGESYISAELCLIIQYLTFFTGASFFMSALSKKITFV